MLKVVLGKTGIEAHKNGFGALPVQRIGMEDAVSLLRRARKGGMNFFDTARFYTDSEEKLGEAFAGVRDQIYLATKTMAQTAEEFWKDLSGSVTRKRRQRRKTFRWPWQQWSKEQLSQRL